MIQTSLSVMLILSLLLPVILAIPVIEQSIPQQRIINSLSLSLAPSILLLIYPDTIQLDLDWLFFGIGLAIDDGNRWILFTVITSWVVYATRFNSCEQHTDLVISKKNNSFALLSITCSIGTILSTDILGFFIFSSIMGYTLYGVLYHQQKRNIKTSGSLYIIFLIIADIALFDALLIAVHTIEKLEFDVIQISMSNIASNQLYVVMTLSGFILRGAVWPAHIWLTRSYTSLNKVEAGLLSTLPVALALLGLIHWLPTDQGVDESIAFSIQLLAICTVGYALIRILAGSIGSELLAWLTLIYNGVFLYILGIFLKSETAWQSYEFIVFPYIALGSITISIIGWIRIQQLAQQQDKLSQKFEELQEGLHSTSSMLTNLLRQITDSIETAWRMLRKTATNQLLKLFYERHSIDKHTDWTLGITLLVILGIIIVGLG